MTKPIEDSANASAIRTALNVPTSAELTAVSQAAAAKYTKPTNGIPATDLDANPVGRTLLTATSAAERKQALGLDQVNNTRDDNKPVSTAQAAALATKMNATMPALQTVFDGGTAAQKAAFQSSVSGYPTGLLLPPPGYRVEVLPTRPMIVNGRAIATKGARDFRPATARAMYVSLATGSDTTGTGTATAPYKSLKKAAQMVAADNISTTVFAVAGYYSRNWGLNGVTPDADMCIIGVKSLTEVDQPGTVISSTCYEPLSWSAHTTAGVWVTTRSAVQALYNTQSLDKNGIYATIPALSTLAAVESATADCYFSSGTQIFLRRADGLTPNNTEGTGNTLVMSNITGFQVARNRTYYTQDVIFEGGGNEGAVWSPNSTAHSTARFVMLRGGLRYNPGNNNLTSRGITTILERIVAYGSALDVLNYHYNTAHTPPVQAVAVEIDCVVYGTGPAAANNNNASTMHDGGTGLRIGGEYFDTDGPVVADVDAGTHTWNVGVSAHGSLADPGQQNAAFQAKDAGMVAGYVFCAGFEAENGFYGTGFVHRSSFAGTVGTLTEMPI